MNSQASATDILRGLCARDLQERLAFLESEKRAVRVLLRAAREQERSCDRRQAAGERGTL